MKFGHVSIEDYPAVVTDFAQHLAEDKMMGNECTTCKTKYFPPRNDCENYHDTMVEFEVNPMGKLKAFTVIHFAPDSMASKAPYIVAIGELEQGVSVLAHLVGITKKPTVGMEIKLKNQKIDDERYVYKFVPA